MARSSIVLVMALVGACGPTAPSERGHGSYSCDVTCEYGSDVLEVIGMPVCAANGSDAVATAVTLGEAEIPPGPHLERRIPCSAVCMEDR